MKIFGSITELVKVVLRKSGYAVTVEPSTASSDTTFQLPAAGGGTKAIVTADSSNTLTNKTFDAAGTGNSISNISNSSIAAGAAIDASKIADGSVSNAEFQTLSDISTGSTIQTQLNAKQATITGGASSITTSNLTASKALQSDASGKVEASSVSNTELGYLSGVTSGIQSQLNNKEPSFSTLAISKGGTGQSTQQAAINALVGTQTANRVLRSDGTNMSLSQVALGTDVSGQLPLANGGTGANYASSNALLNGVLPTQTGNANKFLKSDGTNTSWASAGGGVGKNYLQDFYDADSAITVQQSVGDTVGSSTRSNPTRFGSSTNADLISQSTNSSLRGTTNYLIAFTANAQFVETPLFTLDGSDLGKAMSVQMDVTGVGADDDVQVYAVRYNSSNVLQERIPIAGSASATTPFSAKLPTGTKTFNGFFIPSSTSNDQYAIRILRNANNTSMRIDALVVGPQQVLQGAIVTDWQSFAPTVIGFGAESSKSAFYRRVGNVMEVRCEFVGGISTAVTGSVALPTGFTVDSTTITTTSPVGYHFTSKGAADKKGGAVLVAGGGTVFNFSNFGTFGTTATNPLAAALGTAICENGDQFCFYASIPITEWQSNTQQAARAVEEYAWNSNTADGSNLTAFGYGPSGIAIPSVTSTSDKRVRFQTPILATDKFELEINISPGDQWVPYGNSYIGGGITQTQGITFFRVSGTTTDVDVRFGSAGFAGTPSTAGAQWPTISATTKWRLKKISGGAAVGFPVGARNVIGDTTGTAVPAGYVGERLAGSATNSTTAATGSGFNEIVVRTVTLNKGIYLISSYVSPSGFGGNTGNVDIFINSGVNTPAVYGGSAGTGYAPAGTLIRVNATAYVVVTADNSTVTLSARATNNSTMSGTVTFASDLTAIRIA